MKIHYFIILSLLILNSCDEGKDAELIINKHFSKAESFPESRSYTFKTLFEYLGGTPHKFFEADSGLFVFDLEGYDNSVIHFYDFNEKGLTASFVGKGSGPYESLASRSAGIRDGVLWVLDFSIFKVIETDLLAQNRNENTRELKLPDYFNGVDVLSENEMIGNGLYTSRFKFQKIDRKTGKITDEFGLFEKVPKDFSIRLIQEYFQSSFAIKPDGTKLVTAYRWNEAIEIFDLATYESFLIKGPENINNDFAFVNDEHGKLMFERGGDIQKCYVDLAVTDKFIFLLFSGSQDKILDSHFADTIYIYDWEGSPIKKINLDRKIKSLSASPDGKRIYAFDVDAGEVMCVGLDK